MSGLDLDMLRGRWAEQGARIDAGVRMDVAAVRRALGRRTRSARRGQLVSVGVTLAMDVALLVGLVVYMLARLDQPTWLLMAIGFAAPVLAHAVAGVTQWTLLRALDLGGPVPAALATMARLRELRLRLARMIVLLCVLLWWPMFLLLLNALFGVDLLRRAHGSFVWINLAIGVAFVPVAWGLMRWLDRRWGERPGLRGFLDETAGRGWLRLRDGLVDTDRLDRADDAGSVWPQPLPAAASEPLRALNFRLWLGIVGAGSAILAIGTFNALHGGEWQFIAPGILLNLVIGAQVAFSIENRVAIARCRRHGTLDAGALALALPVIVRQRESLARVTLALAPVWLPALAQVVAKVGFGVDLAAGLGASGLAWAGAASLASAAVLTVIAFARSTAFPRRAVAVLSLGVPAAARRVRAAIPASV